MFDVIVLNHKRKTITISFMPWQFRALLDQLPPDIRVSAITADFEAAMWRAVAQVLPHVQMLGCVFHFTQAVWRKIQALGLQESYYRKNATYDFCKKLVALPFLPKEYIPLSSQTIGKPVS